eukprot:s3446_g6.t1
MGMVYDVQNGKADFRAIGLSNYELATTASGHPAIPICPVSVSSGEMPDLQVEDLRLQQIGQYTAVYAVLPIATPVRLMEAAPCPDKAVPLSRMTKPQLLSEAVRVGVTVHHSWSVPELRATIREHINVHGEKTAAQRMKGLSSMTMPELTAKANEMGVTVPEKTTKGALLKLICSTVSLPETPS